MTKKYKRIKISFDVEKHREAIEILDGIKAYWRSSFVADAIIAYSKSQKGHTSNMRNVSRPDESPSGGNSSEEDFFGEINS